ncbi:MAG TPA: hypothetical protein VGM26_06305 [Rhizomicrobium sp.]|jgi:hypothetical protein
MHFRFPLVISTRSSGTLLTFRLIYGFDLARPTLVGLRHRRRIFGFMLWILKATGVGTLQTG